MLTVYSRIHPSTNAPQRIINVSVAKPLKTGTGGGNRPVWEDEEWIKKYAKPLGEEQEQREEVQEEQMAD